MKLYSIFTSEVNSWIYWSEIDRNSYNLETMILTCVVCILSIKKVLFKYLIYLVTVDL